MVKNLPAMQETQVRSLGHEDPLEKGVAAHSSILAWRIPWTEKPGGYSPLGPKESDMTEQLRTNLFKIDFMPFTLLYKCNLYALVQILFKYKTILNKS